MWNLKHADKGYRAVLLPYKSWDAKPVQIDDGDAPSDPPKITPFQWATGEDLVAMSSHHATPGEFDLLDARSLMERGDYTGAVRRTVTAVEAVLGWALLGTLEAKYTPAEAATKLRNTDNDFPGRLRQWRKLAQPAIGQMEFDEFEKTRDIRHDIVHRGPSSRPLRSADALSVRSIPAAGSTTNRGEARSSPDCVTMASRSPSDASRSLLAFQRR